MNKLRRKKIADIVNSISIMRDKLDVIKDEEEDAMYNIPENLQNSDRYQECEEAVDSLDSAISAIDEAIDYLSDI